MLFINTLFVAALSEPVELYLSLMVRSLTGWVFVTAGVAKLFNHRYFIEAIRNYRLVPDGYAIRIGRVMPFVEMALGVALFLDAVAPWDLIAAMILLLLFTGAVAINLLRGRKNISCGCFGLMTKDRLSWLLVGKNLFFIVLSGTVTLLSFSGNKMYLDSVSERLIITGAAGCIFAIGLITNVIRRGWQPAV